MSGCGPGDTSLHHLFPRARALRPREPGRGGGRPEHAHRLCCGRERSPGAGTRGGAKPGPLPPRAPMYAFYSLLIYIFYSLFRRDGGAAASADSRDPAQVSGGGRSTTCNPLLRAGCAGPRSAGHQGSDSGEEGRAEDPVSAQVASRDPCGPLPGGRLPGLSSSASPAPPPRMPAASPGIAAAPTSPLQNCGPS